MSWSINFTADTSRDIGQQIDEQIKQALSTNKSNPDTIEQYQSPQVEYAKQAALALISAASRSGDDVQINLSGHYNKNCEPRSGFADCMVNVGVSQRVKVTT